MFGAFLFAVILHVGTERPMTPALPEAVPYPQILGDLAADGNVALAAWADGPWTDIRAARIDRNGAVLDRPALRLGSASAVRRGAPAVARGLDGWLVAWIEDPVIVTRFVRDDGSMAEPRALNAPRWTNGRLRAAFDDERFLVAWEEAPPGSDERRWMGSLLEAGGTIADEAIALVSRTNGFAGADLVGEHGGFRLVVASWASSRPDDPNGDAYAIEALRISRSGELTAAAPIGGEATTVAGLSAAIAGGQLVVAWTTGVFGNVQVHVAREHGPLLVLATGPLRVDDLVTVDGRTYALVSGGGEIRMMPIDGGEDRRWDTAGGSVRAARVASFGDRAVLAASIAPAWYAWGGGEELFVTTFDGALADVTPLQLASPEPRLQVEPDVARAADGRALAVWMEPRGENGNTVVAMRLTPSGQPVDGEPIIVGDHAFWSVGVASDGTDFAVVWRSTSGLSIRIVRSDGTFQGPVQKSGADSSTAPCVAWNGREYLIGHVHRSGTTKYPTFEPRAIRMRSDGTIVDVLSLQSPGLNFFEIACAAGRGQTLFVGNPGWGALVSDAGTVSGMLLNPGLLSGAIAWNDGTFLVAASDTHAIRIATMNENGTVTAQSTLYVPAVPQFDNERPLSVAPFGDGFLLLSGNDDVFALRLRQDGTPDGDPTAVAATPLRERGAAVAGGNDAFAVYMRAADDSITPRWRVFTRTIFELRGRRRAVR